MSIPIGYWKGGVDTDIKALVSSSCVMQCFYAYISNIRTTYSLHTYAYATIMLSNVTIRSNSLKSNNIELSNLRYSVSLIKDQSSLPTGFFLQNTEFP